MSKCLVKSASGQQGYNGVKDVIKLKGFICSAQQTLHFFLLSVTEPPDKPLTLYRPY